LDHTRRNNMSGGPTWPSARTAAYGSGKGLYNAVCSGRSNIRTRRRRHRGRSLNLRQTYLAKTNPKRPQIAGTTTITLGSERSFVNLFASTHASTCDFPRRDVFISRQDYPDDSSAKKLFRPQIGLRVRRAIELLPERRFCL